MSWYNILADVILVMHVAWVSYVVLGQLLILLGAAFGWRWVQNPWFSYTHLLCICIVAAEAVVGITCPLTDWENDLRKLAGRQVEEGTFIGRFLTRVIFFNVADWVLNLIHIGFALLVVGTLWLVPPRRLFFSPPRADGVQSPGTP